MTEEKFSDRVKKESNYTREIPIKFPNDVYKEFRQYAKDEGAECFWLAIKRLLDERKLFKKYNELEERMHVVEGILTKAISQEDEKESFPSFGKKVK